MENSTEAQFQWEITKAMTARGWMAGTADCLERDKAVMAQVRNHSEDQVMYGQFPKKSLTRYSTP